MHQPSVAHSSCAPGLVCGGMYGCLLLRTCRMQLDLEAARSPRRAERSLLSPRDSSKPAAVPSPGHQVLFSSSKTIVWRPRAGLPTRDACVQHAQMGEMRAFKAKGGDLRCDGNVT